MSLWLSRIENAPKENYNQLLYDATGVADTDVVSSLLGKGAMIIAIGEKKDTALHLAAKNGWDKKLTALADCIWNVDVKNAKGRTPLWYAAVKGHLECLSILLNHQKPSKYKLEKALEEAVEVKQSKAAAVLLDHLLKMKGMEKCEQFGELIITAVIRKDKDTIEMFMNRGFSINGGNVVEEQNVLQFSRPYQSNPDLRSLGCKFKGVKSNPLIAAILQGDLDMVEWLVEKGAKIDFPVINENWETVNIVEYAAKQKAYDIVEFLKEKISQQALPVHPNN